MMAENSPGNAPDNAKKPRSGIGEILNTPAGVTLLGFFLTGVLGGLVSLSVNAFQRWDQERVATLTERENEIRVVQLADLEAELARRAGPVEGIA